MHSSTRLTEYLGLDYLQSLQDSFVKVIGINIMLSDANGDPITSASGEPGKPGGILPDPKAWRRLCQQNRITKLPARSADPQTGLTTGAVPILFGNDHLGSWIVGPVLLEEAKSGGSLPVVPAAGPDRAAGIGSRQLTELFNFLTEMTAAVMELARSNRELARSNAELQTLAEKLDSTAQMLTKLTNSADVGMYVSDYFTGELLQGNEQYARYVGESLESLIGRPCWKAQDEGFDSFCPDCPHVRLLDERGLPCAPIIWEKYLPGEDRWMRLAHQAIYWVDGRLAHMVTLLDITQIKQMQQKLANFAFYDRGLRIPNALKLTQDAQAWSRDVSVYLICFDIKQLRLVNDMYGRETGDALLVSICEWIGGLGVENAQFYRIGGDDFALVLHGTDKPDALELAQKIYNRFADAWPLALNGQSLSVFCSVSMGLIDLHGPYAERDSLLSLISRTLARARLDGRILVYGEQMDRDYREQLKLELSLKNCVKNGMLGFEVYYQPIVAPSTGTWCGLEALCRWTSPECGPIRPLIFIHKAEQTGLIHAIGRWVLETAVRQCKQWRLDEHSCFVLDVNLSPVQLLDESLVPTILDILRRYDYPGGKLSLEITESTEVTFSPQTMNTMALLRKAGILVALDDFGTGYSSLNNLKQLPVNILKTEQAFIDNLENDPYLQHLLYVMAELAHAVGMGIIVEGVETTGQMSIIMQNGVDQMQGYLFGRPMSAAELEKKLDRFYRPSILLPTAVRQGVKIGELLARKVEYNVTPRLFRILGECVYLLSTGRTEESVGRVLAFIGETFRLGRCYIYWNREASSFSKLFEWCDASSTPLRYSHLTPGDNLSGEWLRLLRETGIVLAADSDKYSAVLREGLRAEGTKSVVLLPFWQGGRLAGFMGCDDCLHYRDWTAEETVVLHSLSAAVCSALERGSLLNASADSPHVGAAQRVTALREEIIPHI